MLVTRRAIPIHLFIKVAARAALAVSLLAALTIGYRLHQEVDAGRAVVGVVGKCSVQIPEGIGHRPFAVIEPMDHQHTFRLVNFDETRCLIPITHVLVWGELEGMNGNGFRIVSPSIFI